jgi:hypothetical protein
MQNDPSFAEALLAADAQAVASTGLGERELALVRCADPAGLAADRDGARRAQFLRNVTAEFLLSTAVAGRGRPGADFSTGFLRAPEFHAAIASGERLAYAFAAYAEREAASNGDSAIAAIAALESAMARARRNLKSEPALERGEVALAASATLVDLPAGTFELAAHVRGSVDRGVEPDATAFDRLVTTRDARTETVMITSKPTSAHRLRDVEVERLEPLVAALLRAAAIPLDAGARAAFAGTRGITPMDVESFVDSLVAEGILARG